MSANPTPSYGAAEAGRPTAIPLDLLAEPGCYVCNWNGYLMRVPESATAQRLHRMNMVGDAPLFVTKISDDPDLPVQRARKLASAHKLKVTF